MHGIPASSIHGFLLRFTMPDTRYQQTAKGKTEAAAKPGALKPGLKSMLLAVGKGSTLSALRARFPKATDSNLSGALEQLLKDAYIEMAAEAATPSVADGGMSAFLSAKPKEPTASQLRRAEGTLSGTRRMKAGFQISILHRPGKPLPARSGNKHGVLIIDGNDAEVLMAANALIKAGFEVNSAATRTEIGTALERRPEPDVIIMDVDLPDVVGLDILGKLREHPQFKETPIVVITGRAERDDIVAALAYGATGYLNKPVRAEALVGHIKDTLGMP